MSIINKVLKDLDKRQQYDGAGAQAGSAVARSPQRSWLNYLVLGVMFVVAVVAATALLNVLSAPDGDSRTEASKPAEQSQEPKAEGAAGTIASQALEASEIPVPESDSSAVAPEDQGVTTDVSPALETLPTAPQSNADRRERTRNEDDDAQLSLQPLDKVPAPVTAPKQRVFEKRSVTLSADELAQRAWVKAEDAKSKGLFGDAADYYQEALAAKPSWHDIRKEWAALEYGRGQLSRALAIVREGLSQYPEAASLRLLAASMLQKQGEPRVALKLLQQLTPIAAELPAYYQLQAELAQQLNDSAAIQLSYERLMEAQPDNGRWHLGLALALREQNPERAIVLFEQAATLIEHQPTLEYIAQQIQKLRVKHEASTP